MIESEKGLEFGGLENFRFILRFPAYKKDRVICMPQCLSLIFFSQQFWNRNKSSTGASGNLSPEQSTFSESNYIKNVLLN